MIDKLHNVAPVVPSASTQAATAARTQTAPAQTQPAFGAMLQQQIQQRAQTVNFSKHALARAEERGIELTPDLMGKLADSVSKAHEKGAKNILAFSDSQAFIINIPYGRVITTMSGEEMRQNIFTNIDGAVLL
ncbi:MAG: flagellar biosynthesis protein [Oscillospiraceae bacterium]|nr:flagellar biosynthesis protein [Oscillospiraceae bacterium]